MAGNPGSEGPGEHLGTYDKRIAKKYGMPVAVVHEEVRRYCAYNQEKVNMDVKHGDKYYMFTSAQRMHRYFGTYCLRTIESALKKGCAAGLIHKKARTGTAVDNNNPKALLYYAEDYGQFTHQAKTPTRTAAIAVGRTAGIAVQNVRTLNETKKSTDLKDQTTSAKARSKEAAFFREKVNARSKTKPQRVPYAQNEHRVRSVDGFKPIGQVINKRPYCPQLPPPIERPLSAWWIRIDQEEKAAEAAAQAAEAAEQEKGLIAGLRDLVIYHLDHFPLPQDLRETLEAAILEEYSPTFDGWDIDVLNAWVKQLLAIQTKLKPQPKAVTETAAEAAG